MMTKIVFIRAQDARNSLLLILHQTVNYCLFVIFLNSFVLPIFEIQLQFILDTTCITFEIKMCLVVVGSWLIR